MPYRSRAGTAGHVFHVLNRGVRRLRLFDTDGDYAAFLRAMGEAQARIPLRILAYCVMPNHFHLIAWPSVDGELSRYMHWLTATHSKRWHVHRATMGTGSVYQGRFKAFPIQVDAHFITVCRYVEQNPLRAGLCARAEDWRWSSLRQREPTSIRLHQWPVPKPGDWMDVVNEMPDAAAMKAVRNSVRREAPLGSRAWVAETAVALKLGNGREPVGRPRESFYVKRKTTPEVL